MGYNILKRIVTRTDTVVAKPKGGIATDDGIVFDWKAGAETDEIGEFQLTPKQFVRDGSHFWLQFKKGLEREAYIRSRTTRFLYKYFPVPPENLRSLQQWRADPELCTIPELSAGVKDAVCAFGRDLRDRYLFELRDMLRSDRAAPVFAARGGNIRVHYMSVAKSLQVMKDLLEFQYGSVTEIKAFLVRIVELLDMKMPKRNCMVIYGPAGSGKTFFGNVLKCVCIIVGHQENFSRSNQFPFQSCVDKRLIFWDEPAIPEPGAMENLKLLFGGFDMQANIKWQASRAINRTPVLVLTNSSAFPPHEGIWTQRCWREQWRECPMLSTVQKYLHPMALFDLFEFYDISIERSDSESDDGVEVGETTTN